MKKMYLKPVTIVVNVQATSMLMQSAPEGRGKTTVQNYNWNEYAEE